MSFFVVVLALQVAVAVRGLLRERGDDVAFEGDKLGYRSWKGPSVTLCRSTAL